MKKQLIVLILFLNCFIVFSQSNADYQGAFNQAVEAYKQQNYSESVELLQRIIDSGYVSSELYYNLGNAYYKLGRNAHAILNFERASLLNPSNDDIKNNLKIARALLKDDINSIPDLFIKTWIDGLLLFLSSNQWAWLALILFAVSIAGFSVSLYILNSMARRRVRYAAISIVVISVFAFILSVNARKLQLNPGTAIVMQPTATVKSSPDYSSSDMFILHEGTKVLIIRSLDRWFEIKLPDGKQGWLESINIEKV